MTKFEPDGHALKTLIWDYEKITLAHAQHDVPVSDVETTIGKRKRSPK